jgi:hypothetical protein
MISGGGTMPIPCMREPWPGAYRRMMACRFYKGLELLVPMGARKWPKFTLGALHTMAKDQEAVDFHQSYRKKPRVWPLDSSY